MKVDIERTAWSDETTTVTVMATLDRPRESTVRQLFAWSMNQCAFPDCPTPIVDSETGTIVADVCHIRAQKPGGLRYDSDQDDEQRHGYENLVLLCKVHHKIVDDLANITIYTVEKLLEIKATHEAMAREAGPELSAPDEVISALIVTATIYESGSVHMDFRNAYFKVGGDGGSAPGTGGGGGGVLTIVGIASVPPALEEEITLDLRGGDGQDYGSGGGGAGVLAFDGRPVTEEDVSNGLQVPLFFPADSARVAGYLLDVLAAGWEYYWVTEFPYSGPIAICLVAEFGNLEANTLLRFEVTLTDPSGSEKALGVIDTEVLESTGPLNRRCFTQTVQLRLDTSGVHTLGLRSDGVPFAQYSFDVKLR